MIVVEMPSAVMGVEARIVCESAASSMPVAVIVVAKVGYLRVVWISIQPSSWLFFGRHLSDIISIN
jgi:hypothetical protein